jgi:hypothetical protein
MTPLGAVVRGLAGGLVGTALMTAYQALVQRDEGGEPHRWADAPAPAQLGKRFADAFGIRVTLDDVPRLTNAVHWGYGIGWGAVYGVVAGSVEAPGAALGAALGSAVWGSSYATLVPLGIYEPPWLYPARELALDLSYHLVYGLGVAAGFQLADELAGRL